MDYLDFEKPIQELEEQLQKTKDLEVETKVDMSKTIREIEKKIANTRKEIQQNLTPWQRVQLSRHPQRPYTLAYIEAITGGN
ncbi:MAG: acetyl-CoA carboxylase carboxyl transferase subunit alpha, partial [Owenweeksia sp.]